MGRWDALITRLFDDCEQELACQPTLSNLKEKIEKAKGGGRERSFP